MPATRSYVASTAQTGNATTYTFTNHNIGTAAEDRIVLVGLSSNNANMASASLSSLTIGGNAASILRTDEEPTAFIHMFTGFAALLVTSGTQATIVLTFTQTMSNCVVSVWALYGVVAVPFASNGNTTNGSSATSVSTTLNIPEQGVAAAIANAANNNVAHTAAGLTEDADAVAESTTRYHSMSAQSLSAETGRTISSTGNASTFRTITAVSFSPASVMPIFRRPRRFFQQNFYRSPKSKLLLPEKSLILPKSYKKAA